MKITTLILTVFFMGSSLFAQKDAPSNFRILQSKAPVPESINAFLYANLGESLKDLSEEEQQRIFELNIILNEGDILFNDEISTYLNRVGKIIKEADQSIPNDLEYMLIKSDIPAILKSHTKAVFLSTGLIARLESEAQLIFFMAKASHQKISPSSNEQKEEITFLRDYFRQNIDELDSSTDKIILENILKKDLEERVNENKKALKTLDKLGINKSSAISALDILKYSRLPFSRKDPDLYNDLFNTYPFSIPREKIDIRKPESVNIKNQSHYIDTKKEIKLIKVGLTNEEQNINTNIVDLNQFEKSVRLSRYALINEEIANFDYYRALIHILLLKKESIQDRFLDFSLVRVMYGLENFKNAKKWSIFNKQYKKIPGNIASLSNLLKQLNKEEINILSLGHIYAIAKKYPEDKTIQKYYDYTKQDVKNYSSLSYLNFIKKEKQESIKIEIEKKVEEIDQNSSSKAERIKNKKKIRLNTSKKDSQRAETVENLFHYGIDSLALKEIRTALNGGESLKKQQESELESIKINKGAYVNGKGNFYELSFTTPTLMMFNKRTGKLDIKKSIDRSKKLTDFLEEEIQEEDEIILSEKAGSFSVSDYNNQAIIEQGIYEMNFIHDHFNMLISNQDLLDNYTKETQKSLISKCTIIRFRGVPKVNYLADFSLSFFFPPVALKNLLFDPFAERSKLLIYNHVYDLEEGVCSYEYFKEVRATGSSHSIHNEVFKMLQILKF